MKIATLTYHSAHNYGAFLQAFALVNTIKNLRPLDSVEIIDYDSKSANYRYIKRIFLAGGFKSIVYNASLYKSFRRAKKYLPLSARSIATDHYSEFVNVFKNQYDLIIVGSDEVWVTNGVRGFPNAYWLPGNIGAKKASFSASSRSDFSILSPTERNTLVELLSDFDYISVRDECTKNEIEKLHINQNINMSPDPVFLWNFGDLREKGKQVIKEKCGIGRNDKVACIMTVNSNYAEAARHFFDERGYKVVFLYRKHEGGFSPALSPFEWISVIAASDFMLSSFFHGTCFALKYNIPFLAIEERSSKDNSRSKLLDLLKKVKLENRYCSNPKSDLISNLENQISNNCVDFSDICTSLKEQGLYILSNILKCLDE